MTIFKGGKRRDDTFIGGDKADRFEFAPADLTSGDTVVGGGGNDTLAFTKRGKVSAEALAHVSGIERVELADGGMSFAVTQQLARTGTDGRLTVVGGAGADTIDASEVIAQSGDQFGGAVTLLGGAGDDTLLGGSDDRLVLDGGEGRDTISGTRATVVYDANDVLAEMTAGGTLRVMGGVQIDLTRADDQTIGDSSVVKGFTAVDASGSKESVIVTAGQGQTVIGGKAADQITGATEITGGGGADILEGATFAATRFIVNEGDFVRGETIQGHTGNDTLVIYGRADLYKGTIGGIGTVVLASTPGGHAAVATVNALQALSLGYVQGEGEVVVELGREHEIDLRYLHDASSGGARLTVHGTATADTIFGVELGSSLPGSWMTVEGGDGDDAIVANADAASLDGGAGIDLLRLVGRFGDDVEIDLSRTDNQGVSGVGALHGFENVNLANGSIVAVTIHGSAGANSLTGSLGDSTLYGEGGDDVLAAVSDYGGTAVLDGGAGNDVLKGTGGGAHAVMTGGADADAFRWSFRSDYADFDGFDTVTDFHRGEDRLEFVQGAFGFAGDAFDTRLVDTGNQTSIIGADLVIYTGQPLNSSHDVAAYLTRVEGGNDGVFIVGTNSQGHAVLFHALSGAFANADSITELADFGAVAPTKLVLSDFAFI